MACSRELSLLVRLTLLVDALGFLELLQVAVECVGLSISALDTNRNCEASIQVLLSLDLLMRAHMTQSSLFCSTAFVRRCC